MEKSYVQEKIGIPLIYISDEIFNMKILLEANHTLEFDKILEYISTKCVSELGKLRIRHSETIDDHTLLAEALAEVSEARGIYESEGGLPLWSFDDIRVLLNKIEPEGSYLDIKDCQKIQNFLEVSADITTFFTKNDISYPRLKVYADRIDPVDNLLSLLKNTIDPSGNIYDNASNELKQIRTQIAAVRKQIHSKLERIKKRQKEHLRDDFISLRDGRLVIPVREFSVNRIPGIVHGQSGTGQTHFIEPMSVVALNNEIFELYNKEKKEIIRILQRLSANIRNHGDILYSNQANLVHLDTLQAKAQYSIIVNGQAPRVNEAFHWDLRNGYHPLLLRKNGVETIPLSLTLGNDYRMIVITGPNAGGKTVALKTVGLLQLLFQCGFHIPVDEGSGFPVCEQIAAIIGDEQSIENDLSTFSSHITKINKIIENPEQNSLVLIDEIGTGTDPAEGSALAISMLENLNKEGIVTIVTTHLGELKAFAHRTDHAANAAMQFDFSTLSPLFKLEVGIPGSSFAFEISDRLGVQEDILNRARELMGSSHDELESMIGELTKKRQEYDDLFNRLSIKETELDGLKSLYSTRAEDLKKKRKKYEAESFAEAKEILDNVNRTIETVIREIKEADAKPQVVKNGRRKIQHLQKQIQDNLPTTPAEDIAAEELAVGQTVKSIRFSVTGQISKIFKEKKQVEIDAKGVKMIIPFSDISIAEGIRIKQSGPDPGQQVDSSSVLNEIDLRGQIADDALIELNQYLDHALNSAWKEVRIIHGKGTGALRSKIHAYLKKNKSIKSYRLGNYGEGDAGVTVIEI